MTTQEPTTRRLGRPACLFGWGDSQCPNYATYEVFNRKAEWMGEYCKRHARLVFRQCLAEMEEAQS